MGLFRRVRDIFVRGDDDKEKKEAQRQESSDEPPTAEAPVETPAAPSPAGTEPVPTAPASEPAASPPAVEPVVVATEVTEAVVVETAEGVVSGAGLDRTYTTKAGDTLESIAAYFYGAEVQRQRLLDDNPDLNLEQHGGSLPGGIRIRVGEDAARGDAIGGSPSA